MNRYMSVTGVPRKSRTERFHNIHKTILESKFLFDKIAVLQSTGCNFIEKETPYTGFLVNFSKIFQNRFFLRHL